MGTIINAQFLADLAVGYSALFTESMQNAPTFYQKFCMSTSSNGSSEELGWMAELPAVRQMLDERQVSRLRAELINVPNLDWEVTIKVLANEINDDKLGIVRARIMDMAQQMMRHRDRLLAQRLIEGLATINSYDGVNFFAATHPRDGGLADQSNTGNTALSATSFNTAYAQMAALTDRNGQPLGIVPDTLFFGPKLRATALAICKAGVVSDGAGAGVTNVNMGIVEPVLVPDFVGTADDYWGLACTTRPVKPCVYQERMAPEFTALDTDGSSERAFMRREYLYGAFARGNVYPVMWEMIQLHNVA